MRFFAAALLATGLMVVPATAAPMPATKNAGNSIESMTTQVQYHKKKYKKRYDNRRYRDRREYRHGMHRYRPGHHYRHRPHGWRSYHHRPHGWYGRGCVVVGPMWFCP